jgi:hypothetical protein
MEHYETEVLTAGSAHAFAKEFDRRIGVDREVNPVDCGEAYVFCFDLTHQEVTICREIEMEIINEEDLSYA